MRNFLRHKGRFLIFLAIFLFPQLRPLLAPRLFSLQAQALTLIVMPVLILAASAREIVFMYWRAAKHLFRQCRSKK